MENGLNIWAVLLWQYNKNIMFRCLEFYNQLDKWNKYNLGKLFSLFNIYFFIFFAFKYTNTGIL